MTEKAIIDVGVLVFALESKNPVREKYLKILEDCIKGKIKSYIPYSVVSGAIMFLQGFFM